MRRDRRAAYERGLAAETAAERFLVAGGYRLLARRFKVGDGEIDIIARTGDTVAFIEVKARATLAEGLTAIPNRAWARIATAAGVYMADHPEYAGHGWRYDMIVIVPGRPPHHEIDAFRPSW